MVKFRNFIVLAFSVTLTLTFGCKKEPAKQVTVQEKETKSISDKFSTGMKRNTCLVMKKNSAGLNTLCIFQGMTTNEQVIVQTVKGLRTFPLKEFVKMVEPDKIYPPDIGGAMGTDRKRLEKVFKSHREYFDMQIVCRYTDPYNEERICVSCHFAFS